MAGIWVSILTMQFPPTDRFTTRPEEKNYLGFSDIAIYHRMPGPNGGPRKPRIALVVQFKGAEHETKGYVWRQAIKQLGDYIFAKVRKRKEAEWTNVYGAVAIGRYVKFFEYKYDRGTVKHWLPGQWTAPYMIGKDCREIQAIPNDNTQNH